MKTFYLSLFIFLLLFGCQEEDDGNDMSSGLLLSVSADNTSISEGESTTIRFALSETNETGNDIEITYDVDGTATSGFDFLPLPGSITIRDGQSEMSVNVDAQRDDESDDGETVIINILDTNRPEEVTIGTAEVTITIEAGGSTGGGDTGDLGDEDTSLSFASSTGNSITVEGWGTVTNAVGYVLLINDTDNFTDLTTTGPTSTTYAGTGQQIVYDGSASASLTVTLLQDATNYYFKVVPYGAADAFGNDQSSAQASTSNCTTDSSTDSEVCFEIDAANALRKFTSNQLPNHDTGRFPNADITATALSQQVPLNPSNTGTATFVFDESSGPTPRNQNFYKFGVATNGLGYNPMGLKPWTNPDTGEENWAWQAAVVNEGDTDLDAFGAHVTSVGVYHYHGDIVGLAADENGNTHSKLYGWAADGFPIYYKYGYADANDATSNVQELKSSYQLKSGARGGNGTDAPDGNHDGTYIQDYEYVEGLGDLDECNGRTGKTPEYPDGTYYYVITSDFPKVPNCFKGTPDDGFIIGN